MNIEFLAVIVGSGVTIILLAVLAELIALRSSVNRSTAAVKDLMTDAIEHEAGAHSVFSTVGADASRPEPPVASSAPDIVSTVQQASAIAAASTSPQLSLALSAAERATVQHAPVRTASPVAVMQPLAQAQSEPEKVGPSSIAQPMKPFEPRPKPSPPPKDAVTPAAAVPATDTEKFVAVNEARRPLTEEERAAWRARLLEREKRADANALEQPVTAGEARKPLTEEERAARRARRLEHKKRAAAKAPDKPVAASEAREPLTEEERAARRALRQERALNRRKQKQSRENAAE